MPITACYDMVVYCDVMVLQSVKTGEPRQLRTCPHVGYADPVQTRAQALASLRKRGWVLNWKAGTAICPTCSKYARTAAGKRREIRIHYYDHELDNPKQPPLAERNARV